MLYNCDFVSVVTRWRRAIIFFLFIRTYFRWVLILMLRLWSRIFYEFPHCPMFGADWIFDTTHTEHLYDYRSLAWFKTHSTCRVKCIGYQYFSFWSELRSLDKSINVIIIIVNCDSQVEWFNLSHTFSNRCLFTKRRLSMRLFSSSCLIHAHIKLIFYTRHVNNGGKRSTLSHRLHFLGLFYYFVKIYSST